MIYSSWDYTNYATHTAQQYRDKRENQQHFACFNVLYFSGCKRIGPGMNNGLNVVLPTYQMYNVHNMFSLLSQTMFDTQEKEKII